MADGQPGSEHDSTRTGTARHRPSEHSPSRRTVETFVARANRLFDLRCEGDGRKDDPYSPQEFADLIKSETGEKVSHTWIWQIRTGRTTNATIEYVEILARFFGVPEAYFFPGYDEQAAKQVEAELSLLDKMKKAGIPSIAALHAMSPASLNLARLANGVSPETLNAVEVVLTNAWKAEGLEPPAPSQGEG